MRKLLMALLLGVMLSTSVGCIIPAYSGDPTRRVRQYIWTSENFRLFHNEWERAWLLDQPKHATPYRTHGGII